MRNFLKERCIHISNLHKQYMQYSESQVCKHEIVYERCCHSVSKAEIVAQCHTYVCHFVFACVDLGLGGVFTVEMKKRISKSVNCLQKVNRSFL